MASIIEWDDPPDQSGMVKHWRVCDDGVTREVFHGVELDDDSHARRCHRRCGQDAWGTNTCLPWCD